jgi:TetR/AcrR family transcriptional repressor of nem operon
MEVKSERTRRLIVEKSAHLFNKKGYHGTSMADILEATGLTKGGVYGHFKGKDEIAEEAFSYAFHRVMDEVGIRVRAKSSAMEKLEASIDFYKDYLQRSPIEGGCPLLNYSSFVNESPPALAKLIAKSAQAMLDSLEKIIDKGKKYGQIRPEIDPMATAELIFSRIEGALMIAKSTSDESRLNRLLERLKLDLRMELAP